MLYRPVMVSSCSLIVSFMHRMHDRCHPISVDLVNGSGETVKDVAKRFGKVTCVEELGGYTDDEDEEIPPEGTMCTTSAMNLNSLF